MSSSSTVKRSRIRRAGESAFGMLLLARTGLMAFLAVLLLVAGAWTSWDTARYAMATEGYERGTMSVAECDSELCRGPFVPEDAGGDRRSEVTIAESSAPETGVSLRVAVRAETNEVVRTGAAGVLYAWVPLAGALLLSSLVVAGGLRLRRTAWVMGLVGVGGMVAAFFAL